ncbi:MAG: Gfo/Idh/MocA family oxidoreductase [Balneolaceae bacterium]|nr:Gfo/Idh/MocA family oxidoreductase [Balneolaceae bacterium]
MKNNRRDFLKKSGLAGLGMAGMGLMGSKKDSDNRDAFKSDYRQRFNMRGYAAPALDVVRVGVMGLGNRGSGTVLRLASIEGVEIKALCDVRPEKAQESADAISDHHSPDLYTDGPDAWKKMCERDDIDLIAIVTPWERHTEQAVFAMEHDKHVQIELPAAQTIEQCWELVEASERTRKHCLQVSRSSHRNDTAFVLKMAREGVFGDIIHAEGHYIHDLLMSHILNKSMFYDQWRLRDNLNRQGNLYPPHGLMPIVQMLDINSGDKMEYLVSVSSNDFMAADKIQELAEEDDFYKEFVGKEYRGNMNTTIIKTHLGRTIMLQHDVTSPRPGARFSLISGTEGIYAMSPSRFAYSHDGWVDQEELSALIEKYTPKLTARFRELQEASQRERQSRGYAQVAPIDWRMIDCLRNGLPMEMDVYDAALSTSIVPLTEWSVSNRSNPVLIPDFTSGSWKTNPRIMDVDLTHGGNTRIL